MPKSLIPGKTGFGGRIPHPPLHRGGRKKDTFPKKPIARTGGKKRITGFGWKREKPQLPLEGVHLMY
jgi:hypothetical protein